MVCRVQNHAIDLSFPVLDEALMILVDNSYTTRHVHISGQISRFEFVKLLPEAWITKYEKLHRIFVLYRAKIYQEETWRCVINFDRTYHKT